MIRRLLIWSSACLCSISAAQSLQTVTQRTVPEPTALHSVASGKYSTMVEAEAAGDAISDAGFGPVWYRNTEEGVSLYVGRMETYTEAFVLMNRMEDYFPADTVSFPEMKSSFSSSEMISPREPYVLPADQFSAHVASIGSFTATARTDLRDFSTACAERNVSAIITSAEAALKNISDQDPAKGHLYLESERARVARDKATMPSLPNLLKVARGEVASSEEDRIEARFLVADSYHYYYPNPLRAFFVYKEILETHGDKEAVKARALVEIAACQLELARSELATYEECRRTCKQILSEVPASFRRAHAVADLIYCETFMYEGDKAQSLVEFDGFELRHPGRAREIAMADLYRGTMHGELGQWQECRDYLHSVMTNAPQEDEESFFWAGEKWDLREKAAKTLKLYAVKFADQEVIEQCNTALSSAEQRAALQATAEPNLFAAFPHKYYEREND